MAILKWSSSSLSYFASARRQILNLIQPSNLRNHTFALSSQLLFHYLAIFFMGGTMLGYTPNTLVFVPAENRCRYHFVATFRWCLSPPLPWCVLGRKLAHTVTIFDLQVAIYRRVVVSTLPWRFWSDIKYMCADRVQSLCSKVCFMNEIDWSI